MLERDVSIYRYGQVGLKKAKYNVGFALFTL